MKCGASAHMQLNTKNARGILVFFRDTHSALHLSNARTCHRAMIAHTQAVRGEETPRTTLCSAADEHHWIQLEQALLALQMMQMLTSSPPCAGSSIRQSDTSTSCTRCTASFAREGVHRAGHPSGEGRWSSFDDRCMQCAVVVCGGACGDSS